MFINRQKLQSTIKNSSLILPVEEFARCTDNINAWALRMGQRNESRSKRNCYTKFLLHMWPLQFRPGSYKLTAGLEFKNVFNCDADDTLRNMPEENKRIFFADSVEIFVSWFLAFMGFDRITQLRCETQVHTKFLTQQGKSKYIAFLLLLSILIIVNSNIYCLYSII